MIYLFIITLLLLITFVIYYAVNRKKIQQHIEKVYIEENRQKLLNQLQTEKQFVEDELLLASKKNASVLTHSSRKALTTFASWK